MIHERQLKIPEIKRAAELSKEAGDSEIAGGVQVLTALMKSVKKSLDDLVETIKEKQKTTEEQSQSFITELQQEISELTKRSAEIQQLLRSEDHLYLHKRFQSLNTPLPTKNWADISICSSYDGTVRRAVAQLEETFAKETEKGLAEAELKWIQQCGVDVTLNPDTANPWLVLSDDGKQVSVNTSDVCPELPDNPERFDLSLSVLGNQCFSSGRFYYEVQVEGKTEWVLGVAKGSVKRSGIVKLNPDNGYWTICLRNGNQHFALGGPAVRLSVKGQCQKVGVYVDYDRGLVSFYDAGAAALLYSFTGCSFTDRLLPYFSPGLDDDGKNSAPLIISPLGHTD
ncbi:hypothetical protein LDENG_00023840 [Lucifuga dentata]|nr:hypothetical protein LDENG_00023840 [Lucifuga dentata]